jgi:hypothetical protein
MVRRGANWQLGGGGGGEWAEKDKLYKNHPEGIYFLREEEEEMGRRKEGVQKIAMMKGVGGEEERLEGGGEGSCGLGVGS